MKGTTNAQRNAVVSSTYSGNTLKLTYANGNSDSHTLAAPVTVDSALSSTSTNPVQNKVINKALEGKVSTVSGKGLSTNDYTTAEKTKVSNLPDNANDTFATKSELTSAVSSVYKYKGTKATHADLPSSGNTTGDVWNVTASHGNVPAGTNWAWNGSAWDALGGEIDLSGYVPTSRKVNGKALSGDITLAASDVSAVPTTRTVNGKALSANITLAASDVGALASNGTAVKATADASGNNIVNTYATKTELTNGLAGKQNNLTFDSAPTSGSSNPVTSGGVYSAINTLEQKVPSGGVAGQVWTSDGSGAGKWSDDLTDKVDITQGMENAGKALVVGSDGNVRVSDLTPYNPDNAFFTIPELAPSSSEYSSSYSYSLDVSNKPIFYYAGPPITPIKTVPMCGCIGSGINISRYGDHLTQSIALSLATQIQDRFSLSDGTYHVVFTSIVMDKYEPCCTGPGSVTSYIRINIVDGAVSSVTLGSSSIVIYSTNSGEMPVVGIYNLARLK